MTRRFPGRRFMRLNLILYAVALLLACGCVVGGVFAYRAYDDRAAERVVQDRYGDVIAAATTEAEAFVNIDYREPEASFDRVAQGATGEFLEQYEASSASLIELLTENESVLEGEVETVAVSTIDKDSATVLVATDGTVTNIATEDDAQARPFRLLLELVRVDGEWLTNNLEFVG